jgi:hypothetical protein
MQGSSIPQVESVAADPPIESDDLPVDGEDHFYLGAPNPLRRLNLVGRFGC